MGRIEALTRALNSLRKVGIRTRTESEDGDGFGRWAGLGTADKPIGTSKATVYASLAGRNRASDVWRRRAQFDDDYQQFLVENRAEQVSESSKKNELTEHEWPVECQSPQERQQQEKRKQKLPSKQRSQSQIDTEAQKRRSRHSSVTLYAADVCDVRPGRQGTPGSESFIRAGHGEPPSTPFTPEQGRMAGWLSPSPSMLGGGGGGSATGTPRQATPPLPLGHISRSRGSADNLLSASWITVVGSSGGIGGSNAGTPRYCGTGGATTAAAAAAAAGPIPPATNSASVLTTGLQPAPSVLLRSNTSVIVGGDSCSGSGSGAYSSSCAGGGGSWGSCICGEGIGCNGTSCQNQPSLAANAGAATATNPSNTSVTITGATSSSSVVRLPSLRQMTQLQHHPSMRALRSSTAAGTLSTATAGGAATTNDCTRQQHFQPQPPTQPPTQAAPIQMPVPMQQPALVPQLQQQQQFQPQQQLPPHKAWDQPRPPTAAVDFRDGRGRERPPGSGPQPLGPLSCRRAGVVTGPPPTSPAVPAAHLAVLSRGQSAQSLMNMLAAAGGSGGSVGSCGGGASCGGASSGSNAGRVGLCPAASEVAVAGLANLDDTIPFDIVDGTGRWFDAGDLSYCNPDCDDEMAQILVRKLWFVLPLLVCLSVCR
ncbi:hypothetical protein Vafri_17946 [Volvox africanus]|uniref:Uncharacterized protein n=1 Tax=Volvox africanus TaxID=51714 RepID=A0A8J4F764_9CHLO|nr:hypothetical protein Vafri_17946 [Volvox africanus]